MSMLSTSKIREALVPDQGPQRTLGLATLFNAFGMGLVITVMALYFTTVLHLSTTKVGIGMTVAGLVGLLGGIPFGHLGDRYGPREVTRMVLLFEAAITICYVFIHGFVAFLIVACLEMLSISAFMAVDGALVRRVSAGNFAVPSMLRAISNLGTLVGAMLCGVALAVGTAGAYRTLIVLNVMTFLVAWLVLGRLPHYEPLPKSKGEESQWLALRDKPFVVYTVLSGILSMQFWVIMRPLPLWVVYHTNAPRWIVPYFLVVNTILVVLFQSRVGRNVNSVRRGGAALRTSGVIFLVSCSLIGLATGVPLWIALLILVSAIIVHTIGELYYTAGSISVSFGLAPEHAQGQYQGLAAMGFGVGVAMSPVLMIGVVLSLGRLGWVGLGVLFALLGVASQAVARWGERTRPATAESAESAAVPAPEAAVEVH
jgi:MFS family permease